jgi:hypothetical protein
LDPIGWIWYALCFVDLKALLWWWELRLGRKVELG